MYQIIMDFLVLCAIVGGPFLGIWAHGKLDLGKQAYERKLDIFKTLMTTRATPLSTQHVEALNRIDIEFVGSKGKKVRDAWKVLLDHFDNGPTAPPIPKVDAPQQVQEDYNEALRQYGNNLGRWVRHGDELRTNLLIQMGAFFDYDFDEVQIRKAAYSPKLHGDIENMQRSFLEMANEVLSGNRSLPMYVTNWPEHEAEQGG